ncbi:GNAT family N-acetyltransferase [Streptomyces sp. G45]|uniref:GNAT family N-acetyltransferase n=1 Tax=Streptomyces sp. G45 TaxID=3406627 RepID=UPI003C2365F8
MVERPSGIIECGDFVLRRWRGQRDLAEAFTLIEESLEHLRPWMAWVERHSEQHTREFLARAEARWASGEAYNYAVTDPDGTPVGMCQSHRAADPQGWRLGYWLHPAALGRGIATRATAAVAAEMLALPGVAYVEIRHDLANTSSGAVPRRLGFTEVRREQAPPPPAPAASGTDVVWRLHRPPAAGERPR